MNTHITKLLSILIITAFLFIPMKVSAQSLETLICPINCDQSRELLLMEPPLYGEDVKTLQEALYKLGFFNHPRDGVYDLRTKMAVDEFQKKFGLNVNGKVINDTWNVLSQNLDKPVVLKIKSPPRGEKLIIIDTSKRMLTLFNDNEPYHQFPVAVGKHETPTPIGNWKIVRKATNWGTGFGTRWMGLNVNWGIYGIHGTNKPFSIGGYQSHGCIRMHNKHVEQLYPWVSAGTPVIIVGNPFLYMDAPYKILRRGDKGSAVMEVQGALKRLGYDLIVDGIFGYGMEKAIIQYRKDAGLPNDNSANEQVYKSLGLKG